MITPPEPLLENSHFCRYFRTWSRSEDSIVFIPLAEICRQAGYLQEAKEICEKGLSYHPQSVSGRLALAKIYLDLKLQEQALPIVEGILKHLPGHKEAEQILYQLVPERRQVTKPSLWETCTMAQILSEQGDKKGALEIVSKILIHNPADPRALKLKETLFEGKMVKGV